MTKKINWTEYEFLLWNKWTLEVWSEITDLDILPQYRDHVRPLVNHVLPPPEPVPAFFVDLTIELA